MRTISDGGEIVGKHVGIKAAHRTEVIDDSVSVDEFAGVGVVGVGRFVSFEVSVYYGLLADCQFF